MWYLYVSFAEIAVSVVVDVNGIFHESVSSKAEYVVMKSAAKVLPQMYVEREPACVRFARQDQFESTALRRFEGALCVRKTGTAGQKYVHQGFPSVIR